MDKEGLAALVREAEGMRNCAHFKEPQSSEDSKTGCKLCGLHVQLIGVKLRHRTATLRTILQTISVPNGKDKEENMLSRL